MGRGKALTSEQREMALSLRQQGECGAEIARRLGKSYPCVQNFLRSVALGRGRGRITGGGPMTPERATAIAANIQTKALTLEQKELALALQRSGRHIAEIARQLDKDDHAVRYFLNRVETVHAAAAMAAQAAKETTTTNSGNSTDATDATESSSGEAVTSSSDAPVGDPTATAENEPNGSNSTTTVTSSSGTNGTSVNGINSTLITPTFRSRAPMTEEQKELARTLFKQGRTAAEITRQVGKSYPCILRFLRLERAKLEQQIASSATDPTKTVEEATVNASATAGIETATTEPSSTQADSTQTVNVPVSTTASTAAPSSATTVGTAPTENAAPLAPTAAAVPGPTPVVPVPTSVLVQDAAAPTPIHALEVSAPTPAPPGLPMTIPAPLLAQLAGAQWAAAAFADATGILRNAPTTVPGSAPPLMTPMPLITSATSALPTMMTSAPRPPLIAPATFVPTLQPTQSEGTGVHVEFSGATAISTAPPVVERRGIVYLPSEPFDYRLEQDVLLLHHGRTNRCWTCDLQRLGETTSKDIVLPLDVLRSYLEMITIKVETIEEPDRPEQPEEPEEHHEHDEAREQTEHDESDDCYFKHDESGECDEEVGHEEQGRHGQQPEQEQEDSSSSEQVFMRLAVEPCEPTKHVWKVEQTSGQCAECFELVDQKRIRVLRGGYYQLSLKIPDASAGFPLFKKPVLFRNKNSVASFQNRASASKFSEMVYLNTKDVLSVGLLRDPSVCPPCQLSLLHLQMQ